MARRRLGRSFKDLTAKPTTHQPCPRCRKVRGGWPDDWHNDLALPPGRLQYICGECYRSSIMKVPAVRLAIQAWMTTYRERLLLPGETVALGPEAALELLIPKLGQLYEEARSLRTHMLVAQAAERTA